MKIRPVGAELFGADGRTDMTTLIVAFRNFAKAPINVSQYTSQSPYCQNTYVAQCCHCAGSRFPF